MFMSSSRNKFTLLYQNSVTDVFVGFLPPCWCPSRWALAWRLHTNLYKSGYNISLDISYTEYSSDLNLGEELGIFTSFHFPDSGLYLLNGFDCYFDLFWTAWHWEPAIANAHDYQDMSGTASNLSISSAKWTSERRNCKGRRKRRALTFFPHTLLPRLLSRTTRAWLLSLSLNIP